LINLLVIYLFVCCVQLHYALDKGLPFLPFIPLLDYFPSSIFSLINKGIFWVFSALILVGYQRKRLAGLMGGSVILLILSSQPLFSNSLLFAACLLMVASLMQEDQRWPVGVQLALLYFGAAINKIGQIDWWNGVYMDFFLGSIYELPAYIRFQAAFPTKLLPAIMGWITMATELALAIMFLIPKWRQWAIRLGFLFHLSMLVITSGRLSVHFFYSCSVAYLFLWIPPKWLRTFPYWRYLTYILGGALIFWWMGKRWWRMFLGGDFWAFL